MKTRSITLFITALAVVALLTALLVVTAGAQSTRRAKTALQVSYPVTYQGRLTDNAGQPIANQTVNITFRLYEQSSGGTPIWAQSRAVTTDGDGLFTTVMEVDPPLGVADLSDAWLGIQVGNDGEMTPRQRVSGAPFAFTLVPGNGVTGTVNLGDWPPAIFGVINRGSGHGLMAHTEGLGAGLFGSSEKGFGGYFTSQEGHALAVDGPILVETNVKRIALQRWYGVSEVGIAFRVGDDPHGINFDGGSIWVSNSGDNTVTRRRASDGLLFGVYPVGRFPIGMAYDGARLWVANWGDNTVTRIIAADPADSTTIPVGTNPNGVCFDGRYLWVVNEGSNNVTRLRGTGMGAGTFNVGQSPRLCACDGTNVWVTNHDSHTVTVLRSSDGSLVRTVPVGLNPVEIIYDGANMWVANSGFNSVTKIRSSDRQVLGHFAVGQEPRGITFDGFHIWVTNHSGNSVAKLRAHDGHHVGTYPVGAGPRGITFDGADIWVVNSDDDTVSKL